MLANIREVLIVSTPQDTPRFEELFGDGSAWGLEISYAIQPSPGGLAQALIIGEIFLSGSPSVLILGDNIYYGHSLLELLQIANKRVCGATVFAYHVKDPERYGVVEFDENGKAVSLEEKPKKPKSNYAVTGLYFYDNNAVEYAKKIKPSSRGELEITDINQMYLENDSLLVESMGRGYAWLDTGTHESLIEAHHFVQTVENRQGLKIACLEEIAYQKKWIDLAQLKKLALPLAKNNYGQYLMKIINEQG